MFEPPTGPGYDAFFLLGLDPKVLWRRTSRGREGSAIATLMVDIRESGAGGGIICAWYSHGYEQLAAS